MDKKSEDAATVIMIAWLVAFYLSICIDTPFAWILFAMFTISEALIVFIDYLTEKQKEAGKHDSRSGKAGFSRHGPGGISQPQQRHDCQVRAYRRNDLLS